MFPCDQPVEYLAWSGWSFACANVAAGPHHTFTTNPFLVAPQWRQGFELCAFAGASAFGGIVAAVYAAMQSRTMILGGFKGAFWLAVILGPITTMILFAHLLTQLVEAYARSDAFDAAARLGTAQD